MCRRAECSKCGRPTYAGCGMHIEQVLGDVPAAKRCRCREERAPKADDAGGAGAGGPWYWLWKVLGK
jgi:hypothetical protein